MEEYVTKTCKLHKRGVKPSFLVLFLQSKLEKRYDLASFLAKKSGDSSFKQKMPVLAWRGSFLRRT